MTTTQRIERGFSVVRVVLDARGVQSLPVGVVAWDAEKGWYQVRVLQEEERLAEVPRHLRILLDTATENMQRWAKAGSVGGDRQDAQPNDSRFWDVVRGRLVSAVRLDLPKAMEPTPDPSMGIEALFDAIVQPRRKISGERKRIDGAVRKALGDLANRLQGRTEVRAYRGVTEKVLRAARSDTAVVVVEGVNLAGVAARREADALVSKLQRIRAGSGTIETKFIVGYLASPGGLNGETHMKYWIQENVSDDVYDLNRERGRFRDRTGALLDQAGMTLRLL